MINKLTLTSMVIFFPEAARMQMGMVFTCVYMVLVWLVRPYLRRDDDALLLLAENEILLLIMCAFILVHLGSKKLEYSVDVAMSTVLIALNILMMLLTIWLAVINIKKL